MSSTEGELPEELASTGHDAATTPRHKPLVGATVNMTSGAYPGCPGGQLDLCGARKFDGFVSSGLTPIKPAEILQKVYLGEGQLPTTPPQPWIDFHAQGGRILISIKPSRNFSTQEDNAFKACLQGFWDAFNTGGTTPNFRIVLWQEPNTGKSGFTASEYKSYFDHYAPLVGQVNSHIKIHYDPALCAPGDQCNAQSVLDFFPGYGLVAGVMGDFYGTAHAAGTTADCLFELANGVPSGQSPLLVGLGEWGASATSNVPGQSAWNSYCDYLASQPFTDWVIYWASGPENGIFNGTDYKIAGFQRVYEALSSTYPTE